MNYHLTTFFVLFYYNWAMKRIIKELYGAGILFFYFFKWPFALGFPWLYTHGINHNIILNILWFYALFLIVKDFYTFYKRKKA